MKIRLQCRAPGLDKLFLRPSGVGRRGGGKLDGLAPELRAAVFFIAGVGRAAIAEDGLNVRRIQNDRQIVRHNVRDARIRRARDLRVILETADIQAIFCNGGTSYASYNKYCRAMTGREAAKLPSTSPANARWTQDKLLRAWREALLPYLSEV